MGYLAGTIVAARSYRFLAEEHGEAHVDIPRPFRVLADIDWQAAVHGRSRAVDKSMH